MEVPNGTDSSELVPLNLENLKCSQASELDFEGDDSGNEEESWPVLRVFDTDDLASLATTVRNTRDGTTFLPTDCVVPTEGLTGSYNICFLVNFSDGCQWIAKLPANGVEDLWTPSHAQSFRSEALTMKLIKHETSLPIPDIYAFNASLSNDLHCPYILMEYIDGTPLIHSNQWFDDTVSKDVLELRRAKVLDSLAAAIVQLDQFVFNQGGQLIFDAEGRFEMVGGARKIDWRTTFNRWFHDKTGNHHRYPTMREFQDPHSNPKASILCMLEPAEDSNDDWRNGSHSLLRWLTDWLFDDIRDPKFMLMHPDLDLQNVLVSESGELVGIIDWEWVEVVPRSVGQAVFPRWLTVDWDHLKYRYQEGEDNCYQNSSKELAHYREIYHQRKLRYRQIQWEKQISVHKATSDDILPNFGVTPASRALALELLWTAADVSVRRVEIMIKIFDEFEKSVALHWRKYRDANQVYQDNHRGHSKDDSDIKSKSVGMWKHLQGHKEVLEDQSDGREIGFKFIPDIFSRARAIYTMPRRLFTQLQLLLGVKLSRTSLQSQGMAIRKDGEDESPRDPRMQSYELGKQSKNDGKTHGQEQYRDEENHAKGGESQLDADKERVATKEDLSELYSLRFSLKEVGSDLAKGKLDEVRLQMLKDGMRAFCA